MPFDKKPLLFDLMPFSAVLPPVYDNKNFFWYNVAQAVNGGFVYLTTNLLLIAGESDNLLEWAFVSIVSCCASTRQIKVGELYI